MHCTSPGDLIGSCLWCWPTDDGNVGKKEEYFTMPFFVISTYVLFIKHYTSKGNSTFIQLHSYTRHIRGVSVSGFSQCASFHACRTYNAHMCCINKERRGVVVENM